MLQSKMKIIYHNVKYSATFHQAKTVNMFQSYKFYTMKAGTIQYIAIFVVGQLITFRRDISQNN